MPKDLFYTRPGTGGTGASGYSGYSGYSGIGYSGASGISGYSGKSGYSGTNGSAGTSGYSGYSGTNGSAGASGYSGYSGGFKWRGDYANGVAYYTNDVVSCNDDINSGPHLYVATADCTGDTSLPPPYPFVQFLSRGMSGFSGTSGYSGKSGYSGRSGYSGYSGYSGKSGYSGYSGPSGYSGYSGVGTSGYSGYSGGGISDYVTNTTSQGISGAKTFLTDITLQNSEFISNATNGRIDLMPNGTTATHYGLTIDGTTWGYGVYLGTKRASDGALNNATILFSAAVGVADSTSFNIGNNGSFQIQNRYVTANTRYHQHIYLQSSDSGANRSGIIAVSTDFSSANRNENAAYADPHFRIYSGGTTSASTHITFHHDRTDAWATIGTGQLKLSTTALNLTNNGELRLSEATANGTNYISFKAPSSLSSDYTYTLPSSYGTSGYFLQTNGSGTLTWAAATASPAGSDTQLQYNSSGTLAGTGYLRYDNSRGQIVIGNTGITLPGTAALYVSPAYYDLTNAATVLDSSAAGYETQPFINYKGSSASDQTKNISTGTSGYTLAGYIKVQVNGSAYWMPYYSHA